MIGCLNNIFVIIVCVLLRYLCIQIRIIKNLNTCKQYILNVRIITKNTIQNLNHWTNFGRYIFTIMTKRKIFPFYPSYKIISKSYDNIFSLFKKKKKTIFSQSTAWYHKDTFILNFFSSDVYDVNIEYVLNDNTVFEEHQKVIRPVLMEVSSATNASSSFNSYPCIEVYLNGACSVLE